MTTHSIDIFPWDDNFNTGLPKVDEQHRKLVELLNLLASHVAFKSDLPQLNTIFDELADYAVYHFETEEAIWHEYLPDDEDELTHKATHAKFVQTVLRLKEEQDSKPMALVVEEALAFLARWLASHILETDRHMAYVVLAMKSGLSVVEAKLRAADQMSGTTRALIDIILSIYSTLSTNTLQLMREIVERKRNEATLMEAKLQAEAANLAKSQFLANMSHEIRTPLNGILGMGQLLLEPEISAEERRDYAKSILDSGKALMALLNGVLDLAAVETGDLVIERTAFAPQGLVHEASRHFREAAEHKGLGLEIEVTVADAASYLGDVARLHQMLSSLLSNAIKFTEHGFVRVAVREVPFGESATALEFSVADTGIGISPEQQDAIFHAFQQGDGSITRRFGGTGLGLAMVRSLAQLMGGTVGVESELGRGSRFWFRIGTDPVAKG